MHEGRVTTFAQVVDHGDVNPRNNVDRGMRRRSGPRWRPEVAALRLRRYGRRDRCQVQPNAAKITRPTPITTCQK